VTSTWVCPGARKRLPYENPQRRRLNTLAVLVKHGAPPALYWASKQGSITADEVVRFLHALPPLDKPLVVVLDNAGIHRSHVVRDALPGLWAKRVYLYYLPPYSPELNAIEPVFRVIKHGELPARRYTTVPALRAAVDTAFTNYEVRMTAEHLLHPRRAA
jgi:putative transposase